MREITYAEAVREAMSEAMREDQDIFMLGEDIGVYGGAFGVSRGMVEEFGEERVRSTPISESVIAGAAVGSAMTDCLGSDCQSGGKNSLYVRWESEDSIGNADAWRFRNRSSGAALAKFGKLDSSCSWAKSHSASDCI